MPKLEMTTAAGLINLNEQAETGLGFQAHTSLVGAGLPPVSSEWLEGAGDGARFRYARTMHRDLDIPVSILAQDRAGLKALVSKFSLALSGPITLWWKDGAEVWSLECRRVGGGVVTYGIDTIGERELRTVVTLRAGDPFWTRHAPQTMNGLKSGQITIPSQGDAPASPTWVLHGPATKFSVRSAEGELLSWEGSLVEGQRITFDTERGTARAGTGESRYHELGVAPRFWRIPPTGTSATLSITGTGSVDLTWQPKHWMVV